MKYINNSFNDTAAALMVMNPKCRSNFKSAASLAEYMRAFAERELNGTHSHGGTFGFEISTFLSSELDPVLCATAAVSGHLAAKAAKAAMAYMLAKTALREINKTAASDGFAAVAAICKQSADILAKLDAQS